MQFQWGFYVVARVFFLNAKVFGHCYAVARVFFLDYMWLLYILCGALCHCQGVTMQLSGCSMWLLGCSLSLLGVARWLLVCSSWMPGCCYVVTMVFCVIARALLCSY